MSSDSDSFDDISAQSTNSQRKPNSSIKRSTSFNGELRSKITPINSRSNIKRGSKISTSSSSIKERSRLEDDIIKKRTVKYDDDEDSNRSHGRIGVIKTNRRKEDGLKKTR